MGITRAILDLTAAIRNLEASNRRLAYALETHAIAMPSPANARVVAPLTVGPRPPRY